MNSPWTKDLDYMLLYMRYIDIPHTRCAEYLNQEVGDSIFTKNSCVGRHARLIANKVFYVYNYDELEGYVQ